MPGRGRRAMVALVGLLLWLAGLATACGVVPASQRDQASAPSETAETTTTQQSSTSTTTATTAPPATASDSEASEAEAENDDEPTLAQTQFELSPVADVPVPVALAARPGTGQRYVASLTGEIWLLDQPEGRAGARQVADIGSKVSQGCENGLLGMAFSPDGSQLFLSYTDTARNSRVAVAPMGAETGGDASGEVPDTSRLKLLLALDQPACNHNGGHIAFGPDGNLWLGFGDGGGANDIYRHGQNTQTLLGTIARIDVSVERGYEVPSDNPFVSGGGAPELWAFGLRNPWRFSFDRSNGDLWIGDVGQDRQEEIHVLRQADGWMPGANLGWPIFEGNDRFASAPEGTSAPSGSTLVPPVYTYPHPQGCSVTGGYVYRGSAIGALVGTYVFGDYCTGALWGLVRGADGLVERVDLGVSVPANTLVSFGEDAEGELYALSSAGTVFRLAAL